MCIRDSYNDAAKNEVIAQDILEAITPHKKTCYIYAPYGSVLAKKAEEMSYLVRYEAFGDRNYNADLSLVSRNQKNAVIEDPKEVLQHLLPMVTKQYVTTIDAEEVKLKADTFCIHGDTPTALQILTYLAQELATHHIYIKK